MVPREDLTERRLDALEQTVGEGFARVDERFKQVDERFKQMDSRLDRIENRLDGLNRNLVAGLFAVVVTLIGSSVF